MTITIYEDNDTIKLSTNRCDEDGTSDDDFIARRIKEAASMPCKTIAPSIINVHLHQYW